MTFLESFSLLTEDQEYGLILGEKRTLFNTFYPLRIFPDKELKKIDFADITIFYGDNGSGKSTLISIIADKLKAERKITYERNVFFTNYVNLTDFELTKKSELKKIKIITSDDVFDYLISLSSINSAVNQRRDELCEEYLAYRNNKCSNYYGDYEALHEKNNANHKTMSSYVRDKLAKSNIITQSNGETALSFWEKEIEENAIYLLDEPENSLSSSNQLKLKKFIEDSRRFYNCQFIIATHSPFLLNLSDARIYDLDAQPAGVKKWNELENVKVYYDFFKEHQEDFQ